MSRIYASLTIKRLIPQWSWTTSTNSWIPRLWTFAIYMHQISFDSWAKASPSTRLTPCLVSPRDWPWRGADTGPWTPPPPPPGAGPTYSMSSFSSRLALERGWYWPMNPSPSTTRCWPSCAITRSGVAIPISSSSLVTWAETRRAVVNKPFLKT